MRWLITFLLILALSVPAFAEDDSIIYQSDFSLGTDGWYARSTGSASISVTQEDALGITGRSDSWHSPGRYFALIPGGVYEISAKVRQNEADSATFMISVAHSKSGAETYENLARDVAENGEWTELSCTYTAGPYDKFVFYVETVGSPDLSFEICDFLVCAPYGEPEPTPEPVPMIIEEVENMPSIREAYKKHFDFGAAVPKYLVSNEDARATILEQFSIVTHENELKPESVLDIPACRELSETDQTAVAVKFEAAKPLLDFAKENNLKVHGHVLVWHSQTPEAFFLENYQIGRQRVSREIMLARLENYISAVMAYMDENYPGVIVSWDVVNEAVDDSTGELRASPWLETIGDDYLARAFEYARQYAPEGTILCYNDYNTPDPTKLAGIEKLLKDLISEGNIDAYGFQMHYNTASPSMEQIETAVRRIADLGLVLRVSELDIKVDNSTKESFNLQAARYTDIMNLLIANSDKFAAVQIWGLTDSTSWLSAHHPLLFDANYNPKPAFWAVYNAAQAE